MYCGMTYILPSHMTELATHCQLDYDVIDTKRYLVRTIILA